MQIEMLVKQDILVLGILDTKEGSNMQSVRVYLLHDFSFIV